MQLQQIGYQFDAYPSLLFVPVGRKYPDIRSIGHKRERAVLSRLQQLLAEELGQVAEVEIELLYRFLGTSSPAIPLPVYKQEDIYPHLIKPEMFLWKKHSIQRGLPISSEYFYPESYGALSGKDLSLHIKKVVRDYLFCAKLHQFERKYWLERISTAYTRHPFIQLASSKKEVIHAVEKMNKSSLLGVLKYPEDVAYWRHRAEIVMRPYRQIPRFWQWTFCSHEKDLMLHADTESISCTCSACQYSVTYLTASDQVVLPNEVNMEQAAKRIATIERQFNEIAVQSEETMHKLQALKEIKTALGKHTSVIKQIKDIQTELGDLAINHPAVTSFTVLEQLTFPEKIHPDLLTLSSINVPDISVLKETEHWKSFMTHDLNEQLQQHLETIRELAEKNKPTPHDVIVEIKDFKLLRSDFENIERFLQEREENIPLHLLVQILKGETTNKIRRSGLHETDVFGLLKSWPNKYITKAMLKSC